MLCQSIERCHVQGDVRKADDCVRWADETARHLGGIDILINCAAGNFLAAAEALSPNGFRTGTLNSLSCGSIVHMRSAVSIHPLHQRPGNCAVVTTTAARKQPRLAACHESILNGCQTSLYVVT
jgi:NAD(P)-dependent dehydrogenase (short-subunit alcohol dehydrogenase family)